jgi:hypothetical protein
MNYEAYVVFDFYFTGIPVYTELTLEWKLLFLKYKTWSICLNAELKPQQDAFPLLSC